ncbi:hypothetical protein FBUS_07619 [Fasciolopsis buskii]|uniref:Uncharacterized protein n=1 Tax=Fasciolopsis buskii TaxID=27845 RepID=A0A8E0RPH7_9TREM|nr:hypothetical protein FBUS_07619 [Fasciolopsis buski]
MIFSKVVQTHLQHKRNVTFKGSVKWLVKHYPVTYLMAVTLSACTAMFGYAVYCVFYNPDITLRFLEKVPRNELYKDKMYNRVS